MTVEWLEELRSGPTIRPQRWAELSGMPRSTVYDALRKGDLPSIRLGSALYIPTAPLLELLGAGAPEKGT